MLTLPALPAAPLQSALEEWCTENIPILTEGVSPETPAATVYDGYDNVDEIPSGTTALQQCMAEQKYVRGAMTRALLYLQVSIR